MPEKVSWLVKITGIVQGVGFRPFVYNLARKCGLSGSVSNSGEGVIIEVEGPSEAVERFIQTVQSAPPPLAIIDGFFVEPLPRFEHRGFRILHSSGGATGDSVVPPDVAVCPDCRQETADPEDRHYRYPFTNCTACGPRFTIVRGLPYDRRQTSMAGFQMCPSCAREYGDLGDRRFHAQPVACPACGPRVELVDRSGCPVPGDPLERCREFLGDGRIVAIKSLGGFHLACSASDRAVIDTLRRRKGRPAKPFAVMCRDLDAVRQYCRLSDEEAAVLSSSEAPIVVLQRKPGFNLPDEIAPGLRSLGVMLPYTPLHLLLFEAGLPVLVMTSGNLSELPLATGNRQALEELGELADYFLWHEREIVNRCDDSVVAVVAGKTQFFRRSRGYVPRPVAVPDGLSLLKNKSPSVNGGTVPVADHGTVVLGAGAEMKNTFCLLVKGRAYLSQHNGEMDLVEGCEAYQEGLTGFCRLLQVEPQVVAYDLHPGYRSSALARETPAAYHTAVQHHHAHMAACMAENGLEGAVIGVILDGTGYGTDGRLWGFEILLGDYLDFSREYHLAYVPLPGGERAVKNPWVTAASYLITFLGEKGRAAARNLFPERAGDLKVIEAMIEKGFNVPLSSGCGRLFDAVSAILNVCRENTYEGEAAVKLDELALDDIPFEEATEKCVLDLWPYPFTIDGDVIVPAMTLEAILVDFENEVAAPVVARRFHDTVAAMVAEAVGRAGASGTRRVVLSGGCWHNRYLLAAAKKLLEARGFTVYCHKNVPPGDGGISLGQAVIGCQRWKRLNEKNSWQVEIDNDH